MFNILPVWQVRTRMASLCVCLGLVTLSHAYVNIALNKPAHQQKALLEGNDLYDASNAVDGLKSNLTHNGGQCTVSADGQQTATWWVNLTSIHSIHHIIIYYRTDNVAWQPSNGFRGRFLGFSVYVSNSTNRLQGIECFKDRNFTLDTIPAVFTTTCPVHGQYVIYYNERLSNVTYPSYYDKNAHNELCEVEVYGCAATGFYGVNCSVPCPDVNCQYCHIETGTCQGCKPGYQGHRCEMDCPAGYYGKECSMLCSETCKGCNNVNGSCDKGCHSGWRGDYCEIECSAGYFGENCASTCGQCMNEKLCHHVTGGCDEGCLPGYKEPTCKTDCDDNKFGEKCSNSCGHCLGSEQCHHINGTCLNGCDSGYQDELCTKECNVNYFGINCREMCNVTCKGCNKTTGICDTGCKPGWRDIYCHKECSAGYYGENCASMCGHCLNEKLCHHVTGGCDEGCLPGYKELTCKAVCDSNLYGENCTMLCGHCHKSEQCHHINGTCMNGCDSGYQGSICMEECEGNHFGPNCNEMCNSTCRSCNKTSGICDIGCHTGWKGLFCHEPCNQRKYGENCSMLCGHCLESEQCHHINGTCMNGCDSGYRGVKCTKECDKHFGPNCIEKCNTTCKSCDISTGVCNNDCHPGWRGLFCHEVCEFGSYGFSCNQECSTFCKRSRDCHHVSGNCKDGCKSGWQGLDCLEVSKLTVTEKKLTSEFNGILSAFCILLFLNGVVITYFAVKRFRNSKVKQPAIYQSNITQKGCESETSNVYINDNNRSEYQELGEISKTETYSTLQDVNSLQQGNKISATLT